MKRIFLTIICFLLLGSTAYAGVEFVATASKLQFLAFEDVPATMTCNKPSGTVDDDVMIALICTGGNSDVTSWTAPTGWTEIFNIFNTTGADSTTSLFYKVADTEGSDYTFTSDGNVLQYGAMSITSWRGCDISGSPLDVTWNQSDHYQKNATSSTPPNPDITTATNGAVVLCGVQYLSGNNVNWTVPTGYTQRVRLASGDYDYGQQGVASKMISVAGTEQPGTWSQAGAIQTVTWVIALKPDTTPTYVTNLLDLKVEVVNYPPSIAGMGNNLIWDEYFDGDLTNWSDVSTGSTAPVITTVNATTRCPYAVELDASTGGTCAIERDFEVGADDSWLIETDIGYAGDGIFEILDSSNNMLARFEFGTPLSDTVYFTTNDDATPATETFPDGKLTYRFILGYNNTDGTLHAAITSSDLTAQMVEIAEKDITTTTSMKVRYTAYTGTGNDVYIGPTTIYYPQMAALGASITQGQCVWVYNTHTTNAYLYRINRYGNSINKLAAKYRDCWISNWAYGGSGMNTTTSTMTDLMLDLAMPTKVYMSYGHNDFALEADSLATVQSQFNGMLTKIQTAGITGQDIIIGNIVSTDWNSFNGDTDPKLFNDWLEQRALEEGFILVDLYSTTVDPSDPSEQNPIYDECSDGTHYGELGYSALAETMYNTIENPNSWWYFLYVR